ncbi:MAG: aspartate kinase [Anaerolineae bacterium]|nr:aspartate kinase [Anaerolineae bacterium]
MTTLAMKFGGTSVGSAEAHRQVAGIIEEQIRHWDRVVVIVSAIRGVTDALIEGARTAASGDGQTYRAIVADLRVRHYRVMDELLNAAAERAQVLAVVDEMLDEFATLCHSVHVLGEVTPRAMDTISSLGERINARILAALLRQNNVKSEAVDASEVIVTDDTFQNAAPLMDKTRARAAARLNPLLEQKVIPIITGFMGATENGIITTLGRGGSDYSGAIIAAAIDADEVWIWTDVDGVMSADPRIVSGGKVIPQLSAAEVSELAYFGAKVLHPQTIRPVIERNIPMWVKNTFNPTFPGTCIVRETAATDGTVKAVTAIKGLSMVNVEGRGMMGVPGIAARTFAAVASRDANVLMISQASSEQSICFIIPTPTVKGVIASIEQTFALELGRRDIERVWAMDDVVIVTAVGAGMRATPGVAARIFGALGQAKINVIAIAQGSSECGISLVVASNDAAEAVRAIHAEFINGKEK